MGTTWMKRRAGKAAAAAAMAAAMASMVFVQGAGATSGEPHSMRTHEAHSTSTSGGLLLDKGGKVLLSSDTYAIWWGSATAWNSSAQKALGDLLGGFNKSNYLGIAQQYMRTNTTLISSNYIGAVDDPSAPPSKVSPSTLGTEVAKEFGTNLDTNGIYFVYTSNFPRGGNFCAWHSYATVNGKRIAVAYMPNTANVAGCDPQVAGGTSYTDEGINSLANVTAHEFMESVTDTQPASGSYAWIDSSGSEIGDKCAWQFNSNVALSDGTTWKLQEEWSNAANNKTGGCVQGS